MSGFHVGLDLGQANDYTAIAVVEVAGTAEEALHVRHLERFRHTLYPDVADRVEALLESPQLEGKAFLVIDATGVGPAVTDIFAKRGRTFKAVKITGGDAESRDDRGTYRVPKRNLVSALQAALQTGTLKIASSLELAEVLRQELLNFRISRGKLKAEHDDMGTVYVWVEASPEDRRGPSATSQRPSDDQAGRIEDLREEVAYLREQLQQANERDRENRRIIAALTSRITAIEAPSEASDSPETSSEGHPSTTEDPEGGEGRRVAPVVAARVQWIGGTGGGGSRGAVDRGM
jgi:hypothetical protein